MPAGRGDRRAGHPGDGLLDRHRVQPGVLQPGRQVGQRRLVQRVQQRVAAGEVPVERRPRDPGRRGDVGHARQLAALGQHHGRGLGIPARTWSRMTVPLLIAERVHRRPGMGRPSARTRSHEQCRGGRRSRRRPPARGPETDPSGPRTWEGHLHGNRVPKDGTRIAFDRTGEGPPSSASAGRSTTAGRAPRSPRCWHPTPVLTYDRRGRGGSGDTRPTPSTARSRTWPRCSTRRAGPRRCTGCRRVRCWRCAPPRPGCSSPGSRCSSRRSTPATTTASPAPAPTTPS